MADVAQLVRAPDCGPGGRGFNSRLSPQNYENISRNERYFVYSLLYTLRTISPPSLHQMQLHLLEHAMLKCSQLARGKFQSYFQAPPDLKVTI